MLLLLLLFISVVQHDPKALKNSATFTILFFNSSRLSRDISTHTQSTDVFNKYTMSNLDK